MKKILEARNLSKRFTHPTPVEILKNLSLTLHEGETLAITGASGEGKSTLLHLLGTLEEPSEGEILICGQKVTSRNAAKIRNAHIGFVFQAFHLLDDATALENVLMPAQIGRRENQQTRALQLLADVGLADRAHFSTKLLSGGEKQRVAIARALMNDPEIILADEPTGNLDAAISAQIHELLMDHAKGQKKGLIVVTHDPALAELCDHTLCLSESRETQTTL